MTIKEKIAAAEILGTKAFKEDKKRNFWNDNELIKMLNLNTSIGSKEGKEDNKIMKTWIDNWDLANINESMN